MATLIGNHHNQDIDFSARMNSEGKWNVSVYRSCDRDKIKQIIPEIGDACPIAGFETSTFKECSVSKLTEAGAMRVELVYVGYDESTIAENSASMNNRVDTEVKTFDKAGSLSTSSTERNEPENVKVLDKTGTVTVSSTKQTTNNTVAYPDSAGFDQKPVIETTSLEYNTVEEPIASHVLFKDITAERKVKILGLTTGRSMLVGLKLKSVDDPIKDSGITLNATELKLAEYFCGGVTSYYYVQIAFSVTSNVRGAEGTVGKIQDGSPHSLAPELSEGMSWLYLGSSHSTNNGEDSYTSKWLAGFWDEELYT